MIVFDLDDTLARTTECLGGDRSLLLKLCLARGARRLVTLVGKSSILLTTGETEWQWAKIRHLRLCSSFASIIVVPHRVDKREALWQIVDASGEPPNHTVVVGDRLDGELQFAKELGCITVRVRLRGAKYIHQVPGIDGPQPDHTVKNMYTLESVLQDLDVLRPVSL